MLIYVALLAVLAVRAHRAADVRPGFLLWIWYSLATTLGWILAPDNEAMPPLSLAYPIAFAIAAGEVWWRLARDYAPDGRLRILIFGAASAFTLISLIPIIPTQWNFFPGEANQVETVVLAQIATGAFLLASLLLMWCFRAGTANRETWLHGWLFVALLAVRIAVYAYPAVTGSEWREKSLIGFATMDAVLLAWCFVIRGAGHRDPRDLRRDLRAA